jgi:cyclophilin family peptidyl-prolyl cis-trans isomerase
VINLETNQAGGDHFVDKKGRLFVALMLLFLFSFTLVGCQESVVRVTEEATEEVTEKVTEWDSTPAMNIDQEAIYIATFKTEKGDIKVELFADRAPVTVNNFVFLAEQGFYDNTTFHRVLANFMAQGGDPTGTGSGGPGYVFEDEFHPSLRFEEAGFLAMANGGPNTNGSQFFITTVPTPHLTGFHTIFGKVVEGMDIVLSLSMRDPQANPETDGDRLNTVEIEMISESLLPPPTPTPIPIMPEVESGRPLADLEVIDRANLYTGRPEMVIDLASTYRATIQTTQGGIEVELLPKEAPESVNNFVVLAELGFWDDFPINYIEPGTFVLTGSPAGDPSSDVGYSVPSEVGLPNVAGAFGYWYREDRIASSGSQFYFLLANVPELDSIFTVFGRVVDGLSVVEALTLEDSILEITIHQE